MVGTNFNILQKPPPDTDKKGWERWYYRVCELLNGGWWKAPFKIGTLPVYPDQTGVDYTEFEADGTMVAHGAATTYNDLPPIPMINLRFGGANNPTLAAIVGNIQGLRFAVGDYLYGNYEVTHEYFEGTPFDFHIHWVTNGTNVDARYVKWEVEYSIANLNYEMVSANTADQVFSAATVVSFEQVILANTTSKTHIYTDIGSNILGTGIKIGAYILYRIRRIAATGTAPTSDPFGLAFGIHIEQNTLGSRSEVTK